MSKLLKLKKWLTVPEAARHLAIVFGEEVSESDVLRLALDGHLKLSVNFVNHAKAKCGKVVAIENAKYRELSPEFVAHLPIAVEHKGKPLMMLQGLNLNDKEVLELEKEVVTLDGVYDLPMIGNERLDIEHECQQLTNGPAVTLQGLDGAFVEGRDGRLCQLQESYDENEYQSGSEAHLKKLEERIARDNIESTKAKELLDQYKEKRKKFLEERKARRDAGKNSENYFPAGGLPHDSVLVVRTAALSEFQGVQIGAEDPARPPGPGLVPRQSVVDEEVIEYWKRKSRIGVAEIAALVCGINPFAYKEAIRAFPPDNPNKGLVSSETKNEIADVITLLEDRIGDPFGGSFTLMQWKSELIGFGVPVPDWLKNIPNEKTIEINAPNEKPLTTNERNSLLTIIAAICNYSDIKYRERGAAVQIAGLTQDIGAAVTDDTIRKALAQIPNALESRKK
jgi:hypothetical protein